MKSFEILHFSYRNHPSYHKQGCYNINLVFRVWEVEKYSYTKERFLDECKEWRKAEIVTDLELEEKYSSGLKVINADTGKSILEECGEEYDKNKPISIEFINTNNIKREDVYTKGYIENWGSMFQYIEKFDVFRFSEYFEINPITAGVVQYIHNLRQIKNPDTYYAEQLFRSLKALENFWD